MDLNVSLDERIIEAVNSLQDEMLESILELVRIDSVEGEASNDAPFGAGVRQALLKALDISSRLGFETVSLDNYIGYAQYGTGEDGYACAIGHVDVVPVGEGWKQPPFSGHMENGTIYSRGILDNKGPVMACLYGLAALKKLGLSLKRPVRIIFGCDEESGFEDLKYYLTKEKPPVYGFTPDCKYPVVYSERGRAVVRIYGEKENLEPFFHFVNEYFIGAKNTGDRLGIDFFHEEYGVMEMRGYKLGCVKTEDGSSDKVSFDVTLSYPGGFSIGQIMGKIQAKAQEAGLQAELDMNYNPVIFEKDSPMVKALQESYEIVTGKDGSPVTTTGGTYAKALPGIVPFGPSFPGQKGIGHNPNEWMTVDDLMANARIYALALYRLGQL